MSGFGGGFGSSVYGGGGGFGSTPPPAAPPFGSLPSMAGPSSTGTFGSSPNLSTTGFGGGGGFTGSFAGSTTMDGFASTTSGGSGGGFGFGSSTTTSGSSAAFPGVPFNVTSTSGGFGSTASSPAPSSLGGFGGFGGNSSTLSTGGFGRTSSTTDMGLEDSSTTPSFGNTATATTSFGGGFGTTSTFGAAAPTTSFGTGGGFGSSNSTMTFGSAPTLTGFGGTSGGGFGTSMTFESAPSVVAPGGGFGSSTSAGGFATSTAFGSAPTPSTGGFGATSTAGGFGTSTAFGSAPTTSTGGFGTSTGGGFGTSTGFGRAPTTSTGGFGATSTAGGFVTSAAFGSAPTTSTGGFGANSTAGGFGASSGGFGTSTTGGFGGTTSASGGFGTSTSFGTSTGVASFGSATASMTTTGSSGFGTNTGGMFSDSTTASSSDFGTTSSGFGTTPSMTFGASSNVITGSSSNQPMRFGQSSNTGWHPKPSANPFAPSTSHDDGMMGDETSAKPDYTNPASTFSTSNNNNNMTFGRSNNRTAFQITTSPIPEENDMGEDNGDEEDAAATAKQRADEEARLKAKIEEKKRLLQAKIEEKKKKLMEKQRQKREQSITPEPDAHDSEPSNKSLAERNAIRFGEQEKSLAQRNAIRFGEQDRTSTREMLPPAMRAKAERANPPPPIFSNDSDQQRSTEREDLKTAKALVGTCQHFCPEEELLRREREGDIQQLEIPMPGRLHPAHWTLQQTAVKRFRRSAADYKLDVPEWVRPPDVLEQVCGYLEEWVMERDRQGPDPRFPQGQIPPPLEVYQFIWDRTRMIRKDFTLQNYVGTGGKCDARAVRCHERIARWHAMCEHQLSHIPDFVTMQSQQNIQELGQTMKTLNQFYDDSLNRATVEVPDENGKETRLDLTGFSHGCTANSVQGQSPVEFDGSDLNNAENNPQATKRILGKHAVNHPGHGTAEPEMRGLYMLLTMNNEGGMEVLKYAARLFQERPEIYASKPVQLALEIFKAKKDYNYARFFSILRTPTTPYLFCCIMFKHVELMRKIAFRIMSKAFGARKKDTGEAIYDAYPLSRLVDLLCFEDVDEARAACAHYNINVKQVQVSASREDVADIIFWRASEFKEPMHPEKGYVLPLQPRKMTRIIEQKLRGATRLAVCRGEVSGEEATIHSVSTSIPLTTMPQSQKNILPLPFNVPVSKTSSEDEQAKAALVDKQKMEASKREQEALLQEQERLRREREYKKKEEERLKREAKEKEKQAKELERQRLLKELELKKQKEEAAKLEEQRKKEEMAHRIKEETKKRELEAEKKRRQEEAQHKADEERRAAEETRRREEEARIATERRQRIAEEQRRQEEAKRQELLRRELQRKRELEAEEKRKAKEWEEKVNAARKLQLWKRWQNRINRRIMMTTGSAASLEQLDPTFLSHTLKLGSWFQNARMERCEDEVDDAFLSEPRDMRRAIDACVRGKSPRMSLSGLVVREMEASQQQQTASTDIFEGINSDTKTTLLLKVALLIPTLDGNQNQSLLDLLKGWIHSRIGLNEISAEELQSTVAPTSFEARSIVRYCRNAEDTSDCDVALILVPPPWSTSDERRRRLSSIRSLVDDSLPRLALVLGEFDHEGHEYMKSVLAETVGTTNGALPIVCTRSATPMALEKALETSCKNLAKLFVQESCIKVDRISVPRLVAKAVSTGLWNRSISSQPVLDGNGVLETARYAISAFIESADAQVLENEGVWSSWPSHEFVLEHRVHSYFSDDAHLPTDWISSLSRQNLERELGWLMHRLTGSFRDVVESFLVEAPMEIREECGMLVSRGYFRRALQAAMHWFAVHSRSDKSMKSYIFFPRGLMEVIFEELEFPHPGNGDKNPAPALLLPQDNVLLETIEEIDQTIKKATGLSPNTALHDIAILGSVNSNKRRHPDPTSTAGSSPRVESPSMMMNLVETKKFRSSGKLQLNSKVDMEESAAFSKRLQDLMMGATVELEVGDDYLSNILRNAPKISTSL